MKLSFEVLEALDAIDRTGTFAEAAELLHRVRGGVAAAQQSAADGRAGEEFADQFS